MTDGAAMDGGDDAEQWWLWCSGSVSRGEARWHEQRWCNGGCGGGATFGLWRWRDHGRRSGQNGAAAAREDNGVAAARWKTNRKENLTVAALYRLEHQLI
jgi:hypothetical protein